MRDLERFAWAVLVVITLGIGIYAGHKVTAAYKDLDIDRLTVELEAVKKQISKANEGEGFWQQTLKMLVEGGQLEGIDIKHGRVIPALMLMVKPRLSIRD